MKNKLLAMVLSISIISSIVPVYAQNSEYETVPTNGYQTDRFIIENTDENPISTETSETAAITAVETMVNEALSEMNVTTETSEVTSIDDNNKVVTLTEEVDAEEFIQSMEDNLTDSTVTIHPDYPVYMNSVNTENEEELGDEEEAIPDYTDFQTNLTAAKNLSTGAGARVGILGPYYATQGNNSYIVDATNFVTGTYSYSSSSDTTEGKIISLIHSVAPDTNIIPIGVFTTISSSNGGQYQAYTSDIVKGIQYAQNHGAHIVVCDWYTTEYNEYLERKMNEAQTLFITSASSVQQKIDYLSAPGATPKPYSAIYPACFDVSNMITVSALNADYSRKYDVSYDDQIDLYSISQYTSESNSLNNASSATAYVTACAALVYGYNHSANNLKSIIMNGAFNVNYLPGQPQYSNYKALSFLDAVEGNTNSETIDITTSHSTNNENSPYISEVEKIYYADIKQVVAGTNSIALLLNDGTVKVCSIYSTTPTSQYFGTDYYGRFTTVPGFPNNTTIEHIALSYDGNGLAAVDSNGDLYVLGKKSELGESSSGSSGTDAYLAPQKVDGISNATDVYLSRNTMYVKIVDNDVNKLKSRGEYPYHSGNNYEFSEVTEAEGYTDIDLYDSKMAFVKDGKAYISGSSSGTSYFNELDVGTSSTVTDVELLYSKLYIRTADKTLYYADTSSSSVSSVYSLTANVDNIAGSGNMLLYSKDIAGNSQYDNYMYLASSGIYDVYTTTIPKTVDIDSICELGSSSSTPTNYTEIQNGTYILTNDQTLYRGGIYNSGSGSNYPTTFKILAQKNFTPQAIDSVVPVNIEEQYGSEMLNQTLAEILDDATDGKATITLADGTDVVVPVTWPTTGFDATQLGTQTFTGTLTLPQGITQSEGVNAVANITIKAPITDVSNTQINADYDDTKAEIIAQLPSTVEVTITKPANPDDPPLILPVTWDTTTFEPQPSSTYTIYGHIQTNDQICNPYDKVSVATVVVGDPPVPDNVVVISITPISINANEGLLLDVGTKPNVGENPQTLVSVPATVTGHTDDGNISLNVTWNDSNYNPFNVGIAQRITGVVEVPEGYALASGVEAILYVTVLPRTYSVLSTVPEEPETTVLGGSSISDVNNSISDHKIGVEAIDEGDSSVVYFFDEYEVISANNTTYDPDTIGHQEVNGSFVRSNITMFDYGYIPVDVNVVSSTIDIVSTAEVDAYQSLSLEDNEDVPETVDITLTNGMSLTADVEWDFANYQKDIAGDQVITGRLVNLPSGVIQSTPERIATLIIHVTAVNYKITYADTPQEYVDAKTPISDLPSSLSSNRINVELESITDGITLETTYDMPFTINADDNTDYDPYYPDLYIINGQFTLPSNISNPDDVLCQLFVEVEPLTITSIEPARVTVPEGTAFADIQKPSTVNVTLSDNSVEQIAVDWGTGTGYDPYPEDLTYDDPVEEMVNGTLDSANVPTYINYFSEPAELIITVIKPRTYYISSISPARIPTTGSMTMNLGSTLTDIYNEIASHSVSVSLVDGNNNPVQGITVNFTIESSENTTYSPTTLGEQTVIAHLDLPSNIQNPNNVQLPIVVNLVKRTVRSATVVRLTNIPYGTSFNDLGLPADAPVQFTDNTTGALPATWNSSTYNPNRVGAQVIRGTFNTPLPVYAENPNNRQPVAAVTVVQANTNIISAEPMDNIQTRSTLSRRLSAPMFSRISDSIETEEIPGLRIRNYSVTMQHEDGSITTEIVPVFETVE